MGSEVGSTILSTSIYAHWHNTRRCVSHDREPPCFTIARFYFPFSLSLFFFRLPRVRDHFRISLCIVWARTKRQTARDSRHGINIDLRILPWSITREMTLANAANYSRLPGETETWTVCYQIAERRQRLLNVCIPCHMIANNFFFPMP